MRLLRSFNKRSSRFQTIRYRLAATLAIALLPVLALSALESVTAFHREAEHQRTVMSLEAQHSAEAAGARIESAGQVLKALGPDAAPACASRLHDLVGRLDSVRSLARFDASGKVICASEAGILAAGGSDWFARLRSGQTMVVARAPVDGPTALIALSVRGQNGGFLGAAAAFLPIDSLRPGPMSRALGPESAVALTDGRGALISTTDSQAFGKLPANWIGQTRKAGSTLVYGDDGRGRRRVYAGAPLIPDRLMVLLSAPRQGVFSWARLNPMATLVLPVLAWILAMGAVLIVSERVVIRWLEYLERIASIYAKGRFSVRPVQARNAPWEIRNLAVTLDQMADAIDARDASLRESIAHKDALMREIHHRVKNNLQVISSLLNMQQRSLTDPGARAAMSDTRQRITALALIYRALYQSPDLRRVDVRSFLEELIAQLVAGDIGRGPLVRSELEADPLTIDPDKLAPLALWAVEAITNAQKHAFEGRGGNLRVRFKVDREESRLEVEDDGPGLAAAEAAGAASGVGRTLMTAFARQLRGRAELVDAPGGGVLARLIFPTPEAVDDQPPAPGARGAARQGNQAAA